METKKSIMIVDDEFDMIKLLSFILQKEGYEVLEFNNPLKALEALKDTTPDLILVDLYLPHMKGSELIAEIKNIPGLKNVPILLISASISELQTISKTSNVDDYIEKPFEIETLVTKINSNLKKLEIVS